MHTNGEIKKKIEINSTNNDDGNGGDSNNNNNKKKMSERERVRKSEIKMRKKKQNVY